MKAATIIIPTFDHGPMLRRSVPSALSQSVDDVEVFIIGDGIPDHARTIVDELVESDSRVKYFDHPKSPRTGEIYRHLALQEASGEVVCYLSDDDLWLPRHVEKMRELLREVDFANALHVHVQPDGSMWASPVDLSDPRSRAKVASRTIGFSLSCFAHTLELYNRLPYGWRSTPVGIPTDLYMVQQILGVTDCTAASSFEPTVLHFASPDREEWTVEQRLAELDEWVARLDDAGLGMELLPKLLATSFRQALDVEVNLKSVTSWRVRQQLENYPAAMWVARKVARLILGRTRVDSSKG